jgi:hypothetical protein
MLTSDELELLTAAVDGELTPRQRRQVARLLRSKPEARRVFSELRGDSRELQKMPAVPAPSGIHRVVVEAVARLPVPKAKTPPARPQPRRLPVWLGYAAAAAVLLAVGLMSFLLSLGGREPYGPVAKKGTEKTDPGKGKLPEREVVVKKKEEPKPPPVVDEMPPVRIVEGDNPDEPEGMTPLPPEKPVRPHAPVLASGEMEPVGRLERVELALPKVHVLHGLNLPAQDKALREQLGKAGAFRVELPARDATRGLERLRVALAGLKTNLVFDANALARSRKPAWRTDFAVYLEDVSPDALAEALRRVGQADRAAALKKASEMYLEGPLVVRELTRWDQRDLKELFGVNLRVSRPGPKAPSVDIRKPLDEVTGKQVTDALEGRGVPRPGSKAASSGRGIVLMLGSKAGKSAELKKFLETRGPARPGTIQVLLVLRNVG